MDDSILHCAFCGKSAEDVQKLFADKSAAICDECILLCAEMLKEKKADKKEPPRCSFCGKLETGQRKLIVGPSGCICNACTDKCAERFNAEIVKELRLTKAHLRRLEEMISQKQHSQTKGK